MIMSQSEIMTEKKTVSPKEATEANDKVIKEKDEEIARPGNKGVEVKANLKPVEGTEDMVVRSTALHDSSSESSWTVEGASLCYTSSIMEIC